MASERCLNAAKVRHSTELPNINQWTRATLYTKPCVSDTSGVFSVVVRRLSPRYACFAEGLVLMLFRIFISQIECIKYVFDWACVKRRKWYRNQSIIHSTNVCKDWRQLMLKLIEAEWRIYASVNWPCIISSDNGLSPDRHQAIIRNNAGIFLIRKYIWKCSLGNFGHFASASLC